VWERPQIPSQGRSGRRGTAEARASQGLHRAQRDAAPGAPGGAP